MKTLFATIPVVAVLVLASCSNVGPNTQRGAAIGALGGAAVGGVIGHQSGHTAEGAALGAVGGAVVGGAVGNAQDKEQGYR